MIRKFEKVYNDIERPTQICQLSTFGTVISEHLPKIYTKEKVHTKQ